MDAEGTPQSNVAGIHWMPAGHITQEIACAGVGRWQSGLGWQGRPVEGIRSVCDEAVWLCWLQEGGVLKIMASLHANVAWAKAVLTSEQGG